mmetsp:Transcript_3079/g.6870  ORF Transcript_3079/g.6870 Transcript_3079/m.6870 type:complete len:225 (-) Transcript_3079:388-1062(-)
MRNGILLFLGHFRIGFVVSLMCFKNGIPTKVQFPSCWYDISHGTTDCQKYVVVVVVIIVCSAVAVCHDCLGIRRLVLVGMQHVVESIMSNAIEKPLDVRTRHSLQRRKAQGCIFNHDGATTVGHFSHGPFAFFPGNFQWIPSLQFGQIDLLIPQDEIIVLSAQQTTCLLQLFWIARDERNDFFLRSFLLGRPRFVLLVVMALFVGIRFVSQIDQYILYMGIRER